jgi:hypothetical protein
MIAALRSAALEKTPVQVAELLGKMAEGGLAQSTFIMYFARAFSNIPLPTLLDLEGWSRLGGSTSDDKVNAALQSYLLQQGRGAP